MWYIAITNPNCHRRAEAGLAAIGYRAFWPKLRKWVSHARTKKAKEYPVLGRYLFVEVPDNNFYAVGSVNGVEAIVKGCDGQPATIPAKVVWRFHDRYAAGEWDFVSSEANGLWDMDPETGQMTKRNNRIPVGAIVRIMEGEFADMLTVIRGRKNGKLEFLPPGKREFFYTREQNVRAA